MKTITAEEFNSKYGATPQSNPLDGFSNASGYLSRVGSSIKSNLTEAVSSQKSSMEGTMNPFSAGANIAKNVTSSVLSPVTEAIRPIAEATIAPALNKITEKITNKQAVQDFTDMMSKYPELSGAIADTIETGLNVAGIQATAGTASAGLNAAKSIATKGVQQTKNAYDAVKTGAVKYPKEISDKITMGKINQQTQTMLKEAPAEKFDRYVQSGMKAKQDPRALTPLEEAGETAVNMNRIIKEDLGNIGKQKSATLEPIKNTTAPNIASEQFKKVAPLLQKKLTTAERKLVNDYLKELKSLGERPTLGSVDATIDKLQATLFERGAVGAIPVTTRVKAIINQSIGELNTSLKSIVDKTLGSKDYSVLNKSFSNKTKVFKFLNKALGEEGTRGGSLLKRFFSPQDAGTKKLFAFIKKEYGVDLAQDATLAKFVMETLGDTRARSLLQLPPTSPTSLIGKGLDFLEEKLTSPERVFNKARTLTEPMPKL